MPLSFFFLASTGLSGAPTANGGGLSEHLLDGDGVVWAVGIGIASLVAVFGVAIAVSNWRAERKMKAARRVAHTLDARASRRPLGEERVVNRPRKEDDGPRSRAA